MKRLVYSPHVRAFVNADEGVIDLSPYITSGSVNRKVNQVSNATLIMRNPAMTGSTTPQGTVPLLWTEGGKDGGPLLHPMDPIMIFMTRMPGAEVQVFTGYIDTAPYLQFYPGQCKVEASCTLKRLLYTQWDAGLPFTLQFLAQFGWTMNGDTGVMNSNAEHQPFTTLDHQIQSQFTDGSIGALLFAVLNVIGQWDATNIWIETLPPQIKTLINILYNQIQADVNETTGLFEGLIEVLLGSGTQGTGSPSSTAGGTVNSPSLNASQNTFSSALSGATGLDPSVVAAWVISEEPASSSGARNGANNWLNIGAFDSGNWATGSDPNWATPTAGGNHTADFLKGKWGGAASGILSILTTVGKSPQTQIAAIQASPWASSHYPDLPTVYSQIVQAGGNHLNPSNTASLAPAANAVATAIGSVAQTVAGQSPGGKTGTASATTVGFQNVATTAQQAVTRQKSAHTFTYGQVRPIQYDLSAPSVTTDCSGFAIACYKAAGLSDPSHNNYNGAGNTGDMITHCTPITASQAVPGDLCFFGATTAATDHVNVYVGNGQSVSMGAQGDPSLGPAPEMGPSGFLGYYHSDVTGDPAALAGSPSPSNSTTATQAANATAFSTFINLPSIFASGEQMFFTGKRSFIADQPLFPFIDQLAQASMRNYMSMPNGNFFAFFPDYFGLFGRKYYWEINDMEVMDARIDLSDDPLVTHVAVAGDVTQLHATVDVFDLERTSGIFDIFDAFATGYLSLQSAGAGKSPEPGLIDPKALQTPAGKAAALAFLQKYGARPLVEEQPMIRSAFFELFYAFMKFMVLWSKQFLTTIELTFMPELFPGGLVAFPDHHIQVYIEEVVHNFDYTSGFTTTVNISSPATLDALSRPNVSEGMARPAAFQDAAAKNSTPSGTPKHGGTFN